MITFAIPFYSNMEFLKKAITSVLNQKDSRWKLLICDDLGGDSEQAEQWLSALMRGHPELFIRYVRNEQNLGMAGNWNRCIELADTDLVTLLHSDDELLPEYTSTMIETADRHPDAAAVFCGAKIIDQESRGKFSFPDWYKKFLLPANRGALVLRGEPALSSLLRGNYIMCPTLCYRKPVIGNRRFDSAWKFVLDFEFTARLLIEGETLVGIPRTVAYAYRRTAMNATSQYTQNLLRFREESAFYLKMSGRLAQVGWNRASRIARRMRVVYLNLLFCIVADFFKGRWNDVIRKAVFLNQLRRIS